MSDNEFPERPPHGSGLEALRKAALSVVKERGLAGLTLRGVADRAHVTHGLVRHHFGSREGLVAATIDDAVGKTLYLEGDDDSRLSERIDSTNTELRIQYELIIRDAYQQAIADGYERYRAEAKQWLESQDIDPNPRLVQVVVSLLDGFAMQRMALGDEVDIDQAWEYFLQLMRDNMK